MAWSIENFTDAFGDGAVPFRNSYLIQKSRRERDIQQISEVIHDSRPSSLIHLGVVNIPFDRQKAQPLLRCENPDFQNRLRLIRNGVTSDGGDLNPNPSSLPSTFSIIHSVFDR